jgi:hypothetical protein
MFDFILIKLLITNKLFIEAAKLIPDSTLAFHEGITMKNF